MEWCIRFKVKTQPPLPEFLFWFSSSFNDETIGQLLGRIATELALGCSSSELVSSLNGFTLLANTRAREVIRENDLVILNYRTQQDNHPSEPWPDCLSHESHIDETHTVKKAPVRKSPHAKNFTHERDGIYSTAKIVEDKKPINPPLSLSRSKLKQTLELITKKPTHLKFAGSDEETDEEWSANNLEHKPANDALDKQDKVQDISNQSKDVIYKDEILEGKLFRRSVYLQSDSSRNRRKRTRRGGKKRQHNIQSNNEDIEISDCSTNDEGYITCLIEKMEPLKGAPSVGMILGFRRLQVSENYTPEISGYKVARVVSYDALSNRVSLEPIFNESSEFGVESRKLLKPLFTTNPITGERIRKVRKFELINEEEETSSPESKIHILNLGDLIDVRVAGKEIELENPKAG